MPPVSPLMPHLSQSLRHSSYSHTLYRRDSDLRNGSLVSVVITVIILSILVAGATLYLARLLWAKLGARRDGRSRGRPVSSSSSSAQQKEKEFEFDFGGEAKRRVDETFEHQPWISKNPKSGKDSDDDTTTAAARVMVSKEMEYVWEPPHRDREGGEVHNRKAKGKNYKNTGRGRSYSDELWSAQVVVDHFDGSSDDDENDDDGKGEFGKTKGSSNIKGGLAARHSSTKARRSRFMSVGGAPAAGFKPLGMHPVREDDLVDVPLRAPAVVQQGQRGHGGPRESWPLRSHTVQVLDTTATNNKGVAAK